MGQFLAELDKENTPLTVNNFTSLAEGNTVLRDPDSGKLIPRWFFRGMKVCRVYPDKAIQTGCPNGDGTGFNRFLDNEAQPEMEITTGSLFMMPKKDKISISMFAIACAQMSAMKGKAPVFGHVVHGLDIVSNISKVPYGFRQIPEEDVVIKRVGIIHVDENSKITVKQALEALRPQAIARVNRGKSPIQVQDGGYIEHVGKDGQAYRTYPGMPVVNTANILGTPGETRLNPVLLMELKGLQQEKHEKDELERKLKALRDRARSEANQDDSELIKGVERKSD
jgi:cyclophilin family peptidyl-prolyl cis-trans isomerase